MPDRTSAPANGLSVMSWWPGAQLEDISPTVRTNTWLPFAREADLSKGAFEGHSATNPCVRRGRGDWSVVSGTGKPSPGDRETRTARGPGAAVRGPLREARGGGARAGRVRPAVPRQQHRWALRRLRRSEQGPTLLPDSQAAEEGNRWRAGTLCRPPARSSAGRQQGGARPPRRLPDPRQGRGSERVRTGQGHTAAGAGARPRAAPDPPGGPRERGPARPAGTPAPRRAPRTSHAPHLTSRHRRLATRGPCRGRPSAGPAPAPARLRSPAFPPLLARSRGPRRGHGDRGAPALDAPAPSERPRAPQPAPCGAIFTTRTAPPPAAPSAANPALRPGPRLRPPRAGRRELRAAPSWSAGCPRSPASAAKRQVRPR